MNWKNNPLIAFPIAAAIYLCGTAIGEIGVAYKHRNEPRIIKEDYHRGNRINLDILRTETNQDGNLCLLVGSRKNPQRLVLEEDLKNPGRNGLDKRDLKPGARISLPFCMTIANVPLDEIMPSENEEDANDVRYVRGHMDQVDETRFFLREEDINYEVRIMPPNDKKRDTVEVLRKLREARQIKVNRRYFNEGSLPIAYLNITRKAE